MRLASLLLILLVFSGCGSQKRYYQSSNIYMRKCYGKEGKVFFEFWEPIKSLNPASGVDADYNEDSTTVRIAFLREPMEGIKYQPDIKSIFVREGDSVVYWRIELPGSVNNIIVTPPDSLFVENINQ